MTLDKNDKFQRAKMLEEVDQHQFDGNGAASGAPPSSAAAKADKFAWKEIVAKYHQPSFWRSTWQIINTLVPLAAVWGLIYLTLPVSAWFAVPLTLLGGGLLVRVFIIHHDCGHGSYFKSRKANDVWGFITGVLAFTPYYLWRWEHSIHHANSGDLDHRGLGAVWTLTVQEYLEASRWKRFAYRLARNPVILFVIAPTVLFLVLHRLSSKGASKRERHSVHWTNLAIFGMGVVGCLIFGVKAYLIIQISMIGIGASAGVWLFYVQHQFEGVYWQRHEEWDYTAAALQGSSFYKLPKILQWFSGNIGFHHIHHLSARIPNYYLEKCHQAEPLFQNVPHLTLVKSLKTSRLRLWDEQRQTLVSFSHLRRARRQMQTSRN